MPSGAINRSPRRSIVLSVPAEFNFERTVLSHGWFDLPPFRWEADAATLVRTLDLPDAGPAVARISMSLRSGAPALAARLAAFRPLTRADLRAARRDVAHMFRLDEDLNRFYTRAGQVERPDLRWAAPAGAGRLLRSPVVFEDLVKMICTTNCTWALTRVMVSSLVNRLGRVAPQGLRLFPDAAAMARRSAGFYRDVVRAGYRGAFLRALARRVARGAIDLEAWNEPGRSTRQIREEILGVEGAGPYVADNMLKLLGRYDGLGIDSWCRRKFSRMYHAGRAVGDRRIGRFYEPFGPWRGLALWCDMTRDWFEGDAPVVDASEKFPQAQY